MTSVLEPYVEFARVAFSRESTYRWNVFTTLGSVILRVWLMKMVWTALYAQNAAPAGITLPGIITYNTIALMMSLILEIDGPRLIREKLREGSIATDLMKPISFPGYLFADGLGQALFFAFTIVPAMLVALLIVHVAVPSPLALATFALSLALGYLLNFCINFCMNAAAFWWLQSDAIQMVVRWTSDLLSGSIIPLVFFPGALQQLVLALPFAAIYSTPLLIYVGNIPPQGYALALGVQCAWLALFATFATLTWRAASRHVIVQGG